MIFDFKNFNSKTILVIALIAILLISCRSTSKISVNDPRFEWLKTLPDITSEYYSRCDGIYMDQTFYHFIYRDSINEYKVTGFITNSDIIGDEIIGEAILEFERNECRFTIFHPCFAIDKVQLDKINSAYGEENGNTFFTRSGSLGFYLDYKIAESDTTLYKWSVPFFFEDVNHDRQKELMLRYPNKGYKIGDRYKVHLSDGSGYKQESDAYYDSSDIYYASQHKF